MVTSKLGTLREFARTAGMFVLAVMTGFLIDVDRHWTTQYETVEPHVRTRNQARLWALMVGLMHAAGIGLIWIFARAAATVFLPYNEPTGVIPLALPNATQLMVDMIHWGWGLLVLVPPMSWLLFRMRLRGGVWAWYAEVVHGLVMLGLVFLGGALALAAVAPFMPIGVKLD